LYVEDEIVSLVGLSWRINFYNNPSYFYLDLVTDVSHRSFGYEEKLLKYNIIGLMKMGQSI